MKKIILTAAITFLLTVLLLGNLSASSVTASPGFQTSAAKSDFITRVRNHARARILVDDEGRAITSQYTALDLGNVLVDGDFTGDNSGITKAQLVSVISSIAVDNTTFTSGHNTNYFKLK